MNKEPRFFAVYMGILISLFVSGLSLVGIFDLPDGILHDGFCRLSPRTNNLFKEIILVELVDDQQNSDNEIWIDFLTQLHGVGSKQIIFSFFPSGVDSKFYEKALQMGNVVFGRCKQDEMTHNSGILFEPLPVSALNKGILAFPYDLPLDSYGVHRFERSYFQENNKKIPSLMVAAAAMFAGNEIIVDDLFAVNFFAVDAVIPKIDFNRILSGELVPELFHDKRVLIGFKKPLSSPGFKTPLHSGENRISLLEYKAYALDTLISGKAVTWADDITKGIFIISMVLLGLIVYPLLNEMMMVGVAGLFAVLSLVVSWGMLKYVFFWPPLFELLLAQFIVVVFIFWRKYIIKDRIAKSLILSKSLQVKERFLPTGFYASKEYWAKVINMINQTLNLERTIFLEKVPDDHRVKEIIALNTSIDDIKERRRDYERTPYSTAIEENKPIQIQSFFKTANENDGQYMVPLMFAGRIQGFWAFVIASVHMSEISTLLPAVRSFSQEIAEILYKREKWHFEEKQRKNPLRRLLNLNTKEDTYAEINQILTLLGRRLSTLDHVFNSLDSAIILYNIFGQVTHVNERMSGILKGINIVPFKMSALDLAVKLTEHKMEEMRSMLSRTIITHDMLSLPVTLPGPQKSYLLSIRPLIGKEDGFVQDEAYPFNLHGMLFEMMDVTDVRDLSTLKAELFERSNAHLKESVESMSNACMMLEDDDLPLDEKEELLEALNVKKNTIVNFMDELNDYMGKDGFSSTYQLFPVSARKLLRDAVQNLEESAQKRKISFDIQPEGLSDLVLATPGDLKALYTSIISVLIEDAYDETAISVKVEHQKGNIIYFISNNGYGMPDEDFQRYLSSDSLTDSRAFRKLHQILPRLETWQARLKGHSELGKGIQFQLRLKRFQ